MTSIAALCNTPLANPPSHIAHSLDEFYLLSSQKLRPLTGPLSVSSVFDTSRVQLNKQGDYVIDEAVVLVVRKNPQLELKQADYTQRSANEKDFGLAAMAVSILFVSASVVFSEIAIPMFIVAGMIQLIALGAFAVSGYHAHLQNNIAQQIKTPQSANDWIELALSEIIARRDHAFTQKPAYVLQNVPKSLFSADERRQIYQQFLDETLIGQKSISDYLRVPADIAYQFLI